MQLSSLTCFAAMFLGPSIAAVGTQEKFDEAEMLYRRALPMFEEFLGKENQDVAASMNGLAGLLAHKVPKGKILVVTLRLLIIRPSRFP